MNFSSEISDSERVSIACLIVWMLPANHKRVWTDFGEHCDEASSRRMLFTADSMKYNN